MRSLTSADRREIADYVSGHHLSLEILGLRKVSQSIYGLNKENVGWPHKIVSKIEDVIKNKSNKELEELLLSFGLNVNTIKSFINYKSDFLQILSKENSSIWNIEGFGMKTWQTFLNGIIGEIGAEIDEPVTIDIHRLIRYPGSLHGKTGFKVQELTINELKNFNPLNETNQKLDPIVFYNDNLIEVEITEQLVPETNIKGEKFGSYKLGEKIEVPHHVAVFLLCKGVAKMI